MALDFPNTPTLNQVFTAPNGAMWMWDGAKWTAIASVSQYAANTNVGRNLIHNPLFNVAQRGVGPFTGNGAYTADRWLMSFSGGTFAISLGPLDDAARAQIGDEAARNCMVVNCTGGAGAGDNAYFEQRIEGVARTANKTITLSFYATSSVAAAKLGCTVYQVFGTGGSPSASVSLTTQVVTLSTTYTRYSLTFVVPSTAGKTLGTNSNDSLFLRFWVSSGATNNAAAGNIGVQTFAVVLWGVQLEVGSVATPLEKPDPQQDLANCQRFYQVLYLSMNTYSAAGSAFGYTAPLIVTMRAPPTIVLSGQSYINASGMSASGPTVSTATTWAASTATGTVSYSGTATASADL